MMAVRLAAFVTGSLLTFPMVTAKDDALRSIAAASSGNDEMPERRLDHWGHISHTTTTSPAPTPAPGPPPSTSQYFGPPTTPEVWDPNGLTLTIVSEFWLTLSFPSLPLNESYAYHNNCTYHPLTDDTSFQGNIKQVLEELLEVEETTTTKIKLTHIGVVNNTVECGSWYDYIAMQSSRRLQGAEEAEAWAESRRLHDHVTVRQTVFKVHYEIKTKSEDELIHVRYELLAPSSRRQMENVFPSKLRGKERLSSRDVVVHGVQMHGVQHVDIEETGNTATTTTTTTAITTTTTTTTTENTTTTTTAGSKRAAASCAIQTSQLWGAVFSWIVIALTSPQCL